MEILAPAVFLSFDDWWINEWHGYLPIFAEHNLSVTFYPCFRQDMNSEYWIEADIRKNISPVWYARLKEIMNRGHTIGYHTVNHIRTDKYIESKGWKFYENQELTAGMGVLAENGIKPRHFAYPYGWHNDYTNEQLLGEFDTLRIAVFKPEQMELYERSELRERRLFKSLDLKEPEFKDYLDRIEKEGKVGFLFGHNPHNIPRQLKLIFDYKRRGAINFYPMGVLDRP